MEHFVTLFNFTYIPQGLALLASMNRNIEQFKLWVLCVDNETHEFLASQHISNVGLIRLSDVITEELLSAKKTRSIAEFCWTLTPFSIQYVFEADSSIGRVTYLDADLWFRKNPEPIFQELNASGKNILITDHAYAPEYDQSETSGRFCVQFMTFSREDPEGVNHWWGQRCLEWCYARAEDGKFGDQKYLDNWPIQFHKSVHVLTQHLWTQAPWNSVKFNYDDCIFYHFHGLKIIDAKNIDIGDSYILSKSVIDKIYRPYIVDLWGGIAAVIAFSGSLRSQGIKKTYIHKIKRFLREKINYCRSRIGAN